MDNAYYNTKPIGSATALVGILNNRTLNIANIGDSGFLIVRFKNSEPYVMLKSKEQQHSFNTPYQLSNFPTKADLVYLEQQGRVNKMKAMKKVYQKISSNIVCQDTPACAHNYSFDLKHGDIIVSATDGVFDNLFQFEILQIIKNFKQEQMDEEICTSQQAHSLANVIA